MNTNFETKFGGGKAATVEWYTPPYIIEALGNNLILILLHLKRLVYSKKVLY